MSLESRRTCRIGVFSAMASRAADRSRRAMYRQNHELGSGAALTAGLELTRLVFPCTGDSRPAVAARAAKVSKLDFIAHRQDEKRMTAYIRATGKPFRCSCRRTQREHRMVSTGTPDREIRFCSFMVAKIARYRLRRRSFENDAGRRRPISRAWTCGWLERAGCRIRNHVRSLAPGNSTVVTS